MADPRVGVHTFIFQQYGFDHTKQTERIAEVIAQAGFGAVEFHQPVLAGDDHKNRIDSATRHNDLELIDIGPLKRHQPEREAQEGPRHEANP